MGEAEKGPRALLAATVLAPCLSLLATPAHAATIGTSEAFAAALVAGFALFSALAGIAVLNARRREDGIRREAADELAALAARLARAEALALADDQIVITWDEPDGPPRDITGALGGLSDGAGQADAEALLDFPSWLAPDSAAALGSHIAALRGRGEGFSLTLRTLDGAYVEAEGRCVGARAMLRLRDIAAERRELARIAERHGALARELDLVKALLGESAHLAWLHDASGALAWVNAAYAKAVEARDAGGAVARGLEFLDAAARQEASDATQAGRVWRRRIVAVVAGARRSFDVLVVPLGQASAGLATDVTEIEAGRKDIDRLYAAHQRTLDNLPTPVAVFGPDRRLAYHNAAWRELWRLDPAFLAERPEEGEILDRLREARRLPEQANYREWKAQHLEAHRAIEPRESWWHLPDGRTLRTYVHPNPQGGVTVIQEDVTEVLDLRSRTATTERTMRETLDALSDAVAVFGSDGRLKLSNPAFERMWRLEPDFLSAGPHIDEIIARWASYRDDPSVWARLKQSVIAFGEERVPTAARIERRDGAVVDAAAVPLPEGATLITFVDVTASVNVERALQERAEALDEKNAALVAADRLKNAFVQHVSYELRSPLTNIIGFAQLLSDPGIGPLNAKQREYMGYIMTSSSSLLAIINDILDLATIDAGVMQLDLSRVDIGETVDAAADSVRDRAAEEGLTLDISVEDGQFTADAKRVRQVLYNLLSNAIGFSERGQTIWMRARKGADGAVLFEVEDEGRGMDEATLARVFGRFETAHPGTGHRGVGLGLSIVKSFAELHGGHVEIASAPGRGTKATVVFPAIARQSIPGAEVAA